MLELTTIPRLTKPHLYDPLEGATAEQSAQIARITGTVGLRGEMITPETLAAARQLAGETGAAISVSWRPWRDGTEQGELAALNDLVRRLGDFQPAWFNLDCERWRSDAVNDAWLKARLDFTDNFLRLFFPQTGIIWYGRGVQFHSASGWIRTYWWTGKEKTEYLTPSLYVPEDVYLQREYLERSRAKYPGIKLCPFVSLGCGYRWHFGGSCSGAWTDSIDYPLANNYLLGKYLAAQNDVSLVALYPQPLLTRYPRWSECFAVYAAGMTGQSADLTI